MVPKIIVLDPGHGGRDPGAVGPTGLRESDVVLAVALRTRDILRLMAHRRGWDIRLTRNTDTFVPLGQRIAPDSAECFISIHCNAHVNSGANGTETFFFAGNGILANLLQRQLITHLRRRSRGVKTAAVQVLRQSAAPAALVELAFISNREEEILLRSADGQERAAQALAAGITEFLLI